MFFGMLFLGVLPDLSRVHSFAARPLSLVKHRAQGAGIGRKFLEQLIPHLGLDALKSTGSLPLSRNVARNLSTVDPTMSMKEQKERPRLGHQKWNKHGIPDNGDLRMQIAKTVGSIKGPRQPSYISKVSGLLVFVRSHCSMKLPCEGGQVTRL